MLRTLQYCTVFNITYSVALILLSLQLKLMASRKERVVWGLVEGEEGFFQNQKWK